MNAYRKTGGGEDWPMHFNVIVDLELPISTMIFEPDRIFGATDATGSYFTKYTHKLKGYCIRRKFSKHQDTLCSQHNVQ